MHTIKLRPVYMTVAILVLVLVVTAANQGKESQNNANNQPLSGLDKMLRQANGLKIDAIVDNKIASNVTNALTEMANNLRKMMMENRRLNQQVQELVIRFQNVTGANATSSLGNLQQQASNFSNLANNLNMRNMSALMPRFNI
jgi:hypothetical protein